MPKVSEGSSDDAFNDSRPTPQFGAQWRIDIPRNDQADCGDESKDCEVHGIRFLKQIGDKGGDLVPPGRDQAVNRNHGNRGHTGIGFAGCGLWRGCRRFRFFGNGYGRLATGDEKNAAVWKSVHTTSPFVPETDRPSGYEILKGLGVESSFFL